MILSEGTFLGIPPGEWAAWGVWATIVVYVVIAIVAVRQLNEARSLREEQSRPVVLVDVALRGLLISISIRNVGPTVASDVCVIFDEPPMSKSMPNCDWLSSTTFTEGIPMMAPGREIKVRFDTYPARHNSGRPMVITGRVNDEPRPKSWQAKVVDLKPDGPSSIHCRYVAQRFDHPLSTPVDRCTRRRRTVPC